MILWKTNENDFVGTNGFEITADTLQYSSMNFHYFYTQSTNAGTIDIGGNFTITGARNTGKFNSFLGGLTKYKWK
jgi:hypothetical protein